jgi:vitamin B12 transporter
LIRRPKNSIGLNAGVRVTEKLFVSSNLSWFDKRKDAYFDAMTFQTVNVVLDSYILLDVYAEYAFCKNKLKVFADLRIFLIANTVKQQDSIHLVLMDMVA